MEAGAMPQLVARVAVATDPANAFAFVVLSG
jgi:hypothetical protein